MSTYKNIIFDVGSLLVNWMRINLYTTLLHGDEDKAKWMAPTKWEYKAYYLLVVIT